MTQFIGRYRILAEIGAGGMGTVYRALDSEIEREVALKWLPGHFSRDTTFVERFKREARVIGRLEHPHIVPIYDVGEHENRPFIVMRLLKGGTLRERIRQTNFDIDTLLTTLQQVADALEVAHGRGIIHRDIKPSNILFDERGAAFLSDFGIAKVLDAATQLTGSGVIGTPSYMSPEQFKGGNIGGQSDQYSLAVVAFEALAGRLPFEGETTAQVMFKHLTEMPPELHTVAHHVPARLSPVLRRALSKEPEDRYESIQAFVRSLRQTAASDPTLLGESLTMVEPITPATPPAAGAGQQSPATTAKMDSYYQQGLEAMNRGDWQRAVNAFDEVLSIDPTYAATRTLRQRAAQQLTQVSRTAAGSVVPPATPPPGTAVSPGGERGAAGGIPRIAKIAGVALVGLLGLAILAGLAFVVVRALSPDEGGPETPVAAAPAGEATVDSTSANEASSMEATPAEEAVALQPTATDSPTSEPAPSAEPTSDVQYMAIEAAGSSAGYRMVGADVLNGLDSGDKVAMEPGTVLQAGEDGLSFSLPNEAHVYLAPETEVELPTNPPDLQRPATIIRLNSGVLLLDATAVQEEEMFIYRGLPGALADLDYGLMGVTYDAVLELFAVDCFAGECLLSSASDTIRLQPNQFSELAADGAPSAAEVARPELYCQLAPALLTCPEATSTPTPTVPPPTFTPTFPPPTATVPPPTQPPPTQPPPTQPPPTQPPPTEPPPTQPPPPPPTYTPEPP